MLGVRTTISIGALACVGVLMCRVELEDLWRENADAQRTWEERRRAEDYSQYYQAYPLGNLIPARPSQGEGDHPLCAVDKSKFYVYVEAPGLSKFCAFDECGSGGRQVEQLGGFLLGDGEHEANVPVKESSSFVLVANERARIIGRYPRCTVADLPIIPPRHSETGAIAAPVPKRLAWNARCRPDLTAEHLSAKELWQQAISSRPLVTFNGQAR